MSGYQRLSQTDYSSKPSSAMMVERARAKIKVRPSHKHESRAHHKRDKKGRLTGKFCNPWPSWKGLSIYDAYKAFMDGATLKAPPHEGESEDIEQHGRLVKVVKPDWSPHKEAGILGYGAKVCWLGHAGVFVQVPWASSLTRRNDLDEGEGGVGILFDPIFSKRCSPVQWFGPARFLPPPCRVADLPPVDICMISHDHYDHLDYNTIMDLYHTNQNRIHFFVPLGLKKWFLSCGIPSSAVEELDWHQEALVTIPRRTSSDFWDSPEHGQATSTGAEGAVTLKVICTPAQHRSGRGIFDHFTRLWSSWVVGVVNDEAAKDDPFTDPDTETIDDTTSERRFQPSDGFRMFFAGDTGYRYAGAPKAEMQQAICPAFQDIADRYGPVDLACLPISTGSSLSFLRSILHISLNHYRLTSTQHLNSWDAMQISRMMGAKATLAIHHSTFSPEDESRGNIYEFVKTAEDEEISTTWGEKGAFAVADVGEVLHL